MFIFTFTESKHKRKPVLDLLVNCSLKRKTLHITVTNYSALNVFLIPITRVALK